MLHKLKIPIILLWWSRKYAFHEEYIPGQEKKQDGMIFKATKFFSLASDNRCSLAQWETEISLSSESEWKFKLDEWLFPVGSYFKSTFNCKITDNNHWVEGMD